MAGFALAFTLLAGCSAPRTAADAQLDKTIQTLLNAIRAHDNVAILSLTAEPQTFGEHGRLMEDVAGFLYDGDSIRENSPDARSVVEIMALGPLQIHILREKVDRVTVISSPQQPGEKARVVTLNTEGRATVLFVPEQFEEQLQVDSFYSERWMRDYFACEFYLIDGRWVLPYNICFAESGGPYHEPYGMRRGPEEAAQELAHRVPKPRIFQPQP